MARSFYEVADDAFFDTTGDRRKRTPSRTSGRPDRAPPPKSALSATLAQQHYDKAGMGDATVFDRLNSAARPAGGEQAPDPAKARTLEESFAAFREVGEGRDAVFAVEDAELLARGLRERVADARAQVAAAKEEAASTAESGRRGSGTARSLDSSTAAAQRRHLGQLEAALRRARDAESASRAQLARLRAALCETYIRLSGRNVSPMALECIRRGRRVAEDYAEEASAGSAARQQAVREKWALFRILNDEQDGFLDVSALRRLLERIGARLDDSEISGLEALANAAGFIVVDAVVDRMFVGLM